MNCLCVNFLNLVNNTIQFVNVFDVSKRVIYMVPQQGLCLNYQAGTCDQVLDLLSR